MKALTPEEEMHKAFNRLRGKLAGFVEALDLDEKQERAIVSTIKNFSYDTEREIISAHNSVSQPKEHVIGY